MSDSRIDKIKQKRISNGVKFLSLVLLIYILSFLIRPDLTLQAFVKTGSVFLKIIPILVLVFGVIYLINRYLDTEKIQKHIGEKSGIKGWLYAAVAGILISGPPYVLYPLFGDLQKKGMRNALIGVILYNRNVKIPFIPVMIYYFGAAFTIIISIYIVLLGFVNGYLVELFSKNSKT